MSTLNPDIKQVAIRLNIKQWKALKNYLTDNQTSFQKLMVELIEKELQNKA